MTRQQILPPPDALGERAPGGGGTPRGFRFRVFGVPAPQGSKRHVGHGVMVESSTKLAPWRQDVKWCALQAREVSDNDAALIGAVVVEVIFYLPRPRFHYRAGRNTAHLLRDGAPARPHTKPDLDKLLRALLDGLTESGIVGDDAQVATIVGAKMYAGMHELPGAEVSIREIAEVAS